MGKFDSAYNIIFEHRIVEKGLTSLMSDFLVEYIPYWEEEVDVTTQSQKQPIIEHGASSSDATTNLKYHQIHG